MLFSVSDMLCFRQHFALVLERNRRSILYKKEVDGHVLRDLHPPLQMSPDGSLVPSRSFRSPIEVTSELVDRLVTFERAGVGLSTRDH